MIIDCVSQPLEIVSSELDAMQVQYRVVLTQPTKQAFATSTDSLYVLRQTVDADGVYILIVAAKMAKEVL